MVGDVCKFKLVLFNLDACLQRQAVEDLLDVAGAILRVGLNVDDLTLPQSHGEEPLNGPAGMALIAVHLVGINFDDDQLPGVSAKRMPDMGTMENLYMGDLSSSGVHMLRLLLLTFCDITVDPAPEIHPFDAPKGVGLAEFCAVVPEGEALFSALELQFFF